MNIIEERSIPVPECGCWIWLMTTGYRHGGVSYGRIYQKGLPVFAHRASWHIHKGPIPEGMNVLHKCDTPACVNPDHLFLGTHQDNMRDRGNKGRSASLSGEQNHSSKVTEQQAISIIVDDRPYQEIADQYGISYVQVKSIKSGRAWKYLDRSSRPKRGVSGIPGVSKKRDKWRARIYVDGKELSLGSFDSPEMAGIAYSEAAKRFGVR